MPVQRAMTFGCAPGENLAVLFENDLIDKVGRKGIERRAVVMEIADHKRTVGTLYHNEMHAIVDSSFLVRGQQMLERGRLRQRRKSRIARRG